VGSRNPWTEEFMVQGSTSEDCLYLNVWTAARVAGGRPVIVWIHGGGFTEGSGSVSVYDGAALARKGVVVVTINYRVGVLGFLAHPELTAESGRSASGNYGLLDQVAALGWVRDNIAAFGGDPRNVTMAGQSAGAMSVYLLMASPLARGLFHRAIVESGPGGLAAFGIRSASTLAGPRAAAEGAGVRFAAARNATSLGALRALPAADLIASVASGGPPTRFGPIVDGYFLPADLEAIAASGGFADVPLLTGLNADEASAFPGYGTMTADAFRQQATTRYGQLAADFLRLYPAGDDREAGSSQKTSARDLGIVALSRLVSERVAASKSNAYVYYFDRAIPWPEHPEFGAFHTAEVPYVFDNLSRLKRPWVAADRRLAETMSSYWVNFAKRGDPNARGLPAWPRFDAARPRLMRLGETIGPLQPMSAERVEWNRKALSRP
jgi:para-nitrobenzyl esterase